MNATFENAAVYCGTYGKYNSGSIAGAWMKLSDYSDIDEFVEACKKLHADESDPELMFQDFEFMPGVSGEPDLSDIRKWYERADELAELSDDEVEACGAYWDEVDDNAEISDIKDKYCGKWDSEEEYAEHIFLECDRVPDSLINYIDWSRVARDLFMDYYFCSGHVFMA